MKTMTIVFFGDWMFANARYGRDDIFGRSSIGVGVRKSISGNPLKWDTSLTKDGKIGEPWSRLGCLDTF